MFGKFFDNLTKPAQEILRASGKAAELQLQTAITQETQALVDETARRVSEALATIGPPPASSASQPSGFLSSTNPNLASNPAK